MDVSALKVACTWMYWSRINDNSNLRSLPCIPTLPNVRSLIYLNDVPHCVVEDFSQLLIEEMIAGDEGCRGRIELLCGD
jgi:hypothetical protein